MDLPSDLKTRSHPRYAVCARAWRAIKAASEVGEIGDSEAACLAFEELVPIYREHENAPRPVDSTKVQVDQLAEQVLGMGPRDTPWRMREPHRSRHYPIMTQYDLFNVGVDNLVFMAGKHADEGNLAKVKQLLGFICPGYPHTPSVDAKPDGSFEPRFLPGCTLAFFNRLAGLVGSQKLTRKRPARPHPYSAGLIEEFE